MTLLGDYTLSCSNPCLQLIVACKNSLGDEDAHEWRGDDLSNAVGFCTFFIHLCLLHGLCPLKHAPSSRIQNDSNVLFHALCWKSHVILTFEINYDEISRQREFSIKRIRFRVISHSCSWGQFFMIIFFFWIKRRKMARFNTSRCRNPFVSTRPCLTRSGKPQ